MIRSRPEGCDTNGPRPLVLLEPVDLGFQGIQLSGGTTQHDSFQFDTTGFSALQIGVESNITTNLDLLLRRGEPYQGRLSGQYASLVTVTVTSGFHASFFVGLELPVAPPGGSTFRFARTMQLRIRRTTGSPVVTAWVELLG